MRLIILNIVLLLAVCLLSGLALAQTYDLPNDDADCPANCRQVPWQAGSDQWNGGVLPSYPIVRIGIDAPCTSNTLTEGNQTSVNNATAINACLNAQPKTAANPRTVVVPAGVYYVNSSIVMKNYVALRGARASSVPWLPAADATATTFKLGTSGGVDFGTGTSSVRGSQVSITSGYTKGSTSLILASISGISVGTWLLVSENADTAIPVNKTGQDGACNWCGQDDGVHLMNQFVQVTAINQGGCGATCVNINRPMYYTFKSTLNPVVRTLAFEVTKAGIENIRLDSTGANHGSGSLIDMGNSLYCWVKGVETYLGGGSSGSAHIHVGWSHGNEIRDSYWHYGFAFASGANYGLHFMWANSDHKVENNIGRVNRHGFVCEGGCAGVVVLYNYLDDIHEDDLTYFGASLINHGAHPYMNLYEGNAFSHLIADQYWGTSSHNALFRNWLWGDETTPIASEWLYPAGALTKPNWAFRPVEIWSQQHYYSLVGNVLGITGKWQNPNWAGYATLTSGCGSDAMYNYGCQFNSGGGADTSAYTTSINHGNWDYKTHSVAYWDGGANHSLKNSMYYASKPTWMGSYTWPIFGPENNPTVNALPAMDRFNGIPPPGGGSKPTSPTGLTVIVH